MSREEFLKKEIATDIDHLSLHGLESLMDYAHYLRTRENEKPTPEDIENVEDNPLLKLVGIFADEVEEDIDKALYG